MHSKRPRGATARVQSGRRVAPTRGRGARGRFGAGAGAPGGEELLELGGEEVDLGPDGGVRLGAAAGRTGGDAGPEAGEEGVEEGGEERH